MYKPYVKHHSSSQGTDQSCMLVGGTGQTSLFGNNQNKLGATLGTIGTFGGTGFNTGTTSLGFGTTQQPVGKTEGMLFPTFFKLVKK